MSSKVEFMVNKRIEIEQDDGEYKSNIQDVTEDYIGISIPVNNGKYLPLKKGEKVVGFYYYEKDVYRFETVVIGRKIDKILIIMLKIPDKITIVQRRNYVRVPVMMNVYCALITTEKTIENVNDNQIEFFDGYSVDISGGGMKLAFDRKFEDKLKNGDLLLVTIPLKDKNLTLKGRLIRVDKNRKNPKILCGLSFTDADQKSREGIITLVFEIMREQMKNRTKGD